MSRLLRLLALVLALAFQLRTLQAADTPLTVSGRPLDGTARISIEAILGSLTNQAAPAGIYTAGIEHRVSARRDRIDHTARVGFQILQGNPTEFVLQLAGDGEITGVSGDALLDWSVRRGTNGTRHLVLRRPRTETAPAVVTFQLTARHEFPANSTSNAPTQLLSFAPPVAGLLDGHLRIDADPALEPRAARLAGLAPIEPEFLPESLRGAPAPGAARPLAYRFQGAAYTLTLELQTADPDARRIVLRDFRLEGQLAERSADFTLTAVARVANPAGGTLDLLTGGVGLSELDRNPESRLRWENGRFILAFDKAGEFPVRIRFHAGVRTANGWSRVDFRVAQASLQPITLAGLDADTQFEFDGAAKPVRNGDRFTSFLPPDGSVRLAWKAARTETEGRLFYAADLLTQVSVGPGLLRQTTLVEGRIMQGEMNRVSLAVRGPGSITAVQSPHLLGWEIIPGTSPAERTLIVRFNQPRKDSFSLTVQMQNELAAFPQSIDALELRPEGATRLAGHVRIVNDGAVRLEVLRATGLSQVAPEQFPESEATNALFATRGTQRFVYRYSGAEHALRIQADTIQPEVGVSALVAFHLGENETAIDAEFELDIREAPLREVLLRIPRGHVVARINAAGMADYFIREPAGEPDAELRLVYAAPVAERQVIQLRLERNGALGQTNWTLPRLEVLRARSTRGHVAVSADAGFRLTPDRLAGLSEVATAFFPRKINGIQAAFRITDPAWSASVRIERLPQSVQADAFHLFSIGEGIAYGSSVVNFHVSGAPVSTFDLALSDEYFNVEFTGKDLRGNWQRTPNGYRVTLNTPVSGPYTLLATYERPFKAQGDTLNFTGARPLDAQSEQGHTLIVSAYQFQVTPSNVSAGLLALETAEVPAEYRLFFDAPILAAYRYTARPFNLTLGLAPLAQGETLSLVVDRASLSTRISKDGEVLTDVRYFIKNRGNPHLRLTLPQGVTLWSATVNGATVVPVKDGDASLVPLPQRADPNAIQTLDLKLASRSPNPARIVAAAPVVGAPVLLADWKIHPDAGRRLVWRGGSLTPAAGVPDRTAFATLTTLLSHRGNLQVLAALALLACITLIASRWSLQAPASASAVRRIGGRLLSLGALTAAIAIAITSLTGTRQAPAPAPTPELEFLAPIQQPGSALQIDVENLASIPAANLSLAPAWPALLALAAWIFAFARMNSPLQPVAVAAGWTCLAWATLRLPGDLRPFGLVLLAFALVHVVLPILKAAGWRSPNTPPSTPPTSTPVPPTDAGPSTPATAATAATAALLLVAGIFLAPPRAQAAEPPLAESVVQSVRVEDKFAIATARIRWHARRNESLPLLADPAVLTRATFPTNALRLVQADGLPWPARVPEIANNQVQAPAQIVNPATNPPNQPRRAHHVLAQADGTYDIEIEYQVHVSQRAGLSGFVLPTRHGLVNRLTLTLPDQDVDVTSAEAVAIRRLTAPSTGNAANPSTNGTQVEIVLSPATDPWIAWRPRSRDLQNEKPVFFTDISHLFIPSAGLVDGLHLVQVRPAQGQLSELVLLIPAGATVSDVADLNALIQSRNATDAKAKAAVPAPVVSLWRFDPDSRRLRVTLAPAQSRGFSIVVYTQTPTGGLPTEQTLQLPSVVGAAGQVGAVGIATGNEVQLDTVTPDALAPIHLEDFPNAALQLRVAGQPGLALRRAFRHADARGALTLRASAVEPDVRVETQETLSLGDDRSVLAANLKVAVTRAGIFRLTFPLPAGYDVESIGGPALSHWTELKSDTNRIVTLHLKSRTEGEHPFTISLAGPGTRGLTNLTAPRLAIREASKQRGQLVIVPEQGIRLQPARRDGVTQLDPEKSGIRQKGVFAFRLLQPDWLLTLELEQVDAWVQVTGLQHLVLGEAQIRTTANLQYQIENTGLKSLLVRVPTNAAALRFRGEQVADFVPVAGAITNGLQTWEVKLHRRIIGRYLLQATWQTALPDGATATVVQGIQAADARMQRGFLTLQAAGRLQVGVTNLPPTLQPTEWQSVPRLLLQDLETATASHAYRLVEAGVALPLQIVRHEAAKLLPARVQHAHLTSVISDEGVMLTQVRIDLVPGDKRLLHLTLPADARFWFAFVNQNGVWPWREQDRILIPLEQESQPDKPISVEFFYSSRIGNPAGRRLDLALSGPRFDLPLEDIVWNVHLNDKWRLEDWSGTLQLQETGTLPAGQVVVDVKGYLNNEEVLNRAKTKAAEQQLQFGNQLLAEGNPQLARRAFQNAYGLSRHDNAFNEDARVQLHNLKLQQALIGLNFRQNGDLLAGQPAEANRANGNLSQLRNRTEANYTQQEAKQVLELNNADDNALLTRLAERIIAQQDAAVPTPAAIRAAIPQQGRILSFRRAVQVETFTDLNVRIQASAAGTANLPARAATLAALGLALTTVVLTLRRKP